MSEHTELRDSNRESMGLTDVTEDVQLKYYKSCAYENTPVISLVSLGIKGKPKAVKTSYFFMNEGNPEKAEEKDSLFDDRGRITEEKLVKYDIVEKLVLKNWTYSEDKLVLLESESGDNILRVDYLYREGVYVGKKIRNNGNVSHFINYLYGNNVVIEERYGSNGKIETRTKKGYNEKGEEIESVLSFNFYDHHHRFSYKYDVNGRLVLTEKWDCDNILADSVLFEYNEEGDLSKSVNSVTGLVLDYVYEYDENANWKEKKIYNDGILQSFWSRVCRY